MLTSQTGGKAQPAVTVGTDPGVGTEKARVLVPAEVNIPLPRDTMEQIAIPASVNGRDLSRRQP